MELMEELYSKVAYSVQQSYISYHNITAETQNAAYQRRILLLNISFWFYCLSDHPDMTTVDFRGRNKITTTTIKSHFHAPPQKVAGYYVIPSEILSVCPCMTRRRAEIENGHSTYIFSGIIPVYNFQYRNRFRSITLIPLKIISQNLIEI